jgi:hypothetical protein
MRVGGWARETRSVADAIALPPMINELVVERLERYLLVDSANHSRFTGPSHGFYPVMTICQALIGLD